MTFCRYCNKPNTPEERTHYGMWRRWEKKLVGNGDFTAHVLDVKRLVRDIEKLKKRILELETAAREE